MPPGVVHLVRHAEAHRSAKGQPYLDDPSLTDRGHQECAALAANFPHHFSITKILCSPLKRTVQTTLESFYPAVSALYRSDPRWHIDAEPYFLSRGAEYPATTIRA
ncbi:hypothetical protein ABW20_dc0109587 [Dactylellina cionopaga]|nr:hypothetical protein ABW20_dc0109587 [Dactylellina cionopaga]